MNKQELVDNNNQLDNMSNRKGIPGSLGNTKPGDNEHATPDRPPAGSSDHRSHVDEDGPHQSNDMTGAYPQSPGGANDLAADQKMDDDTGLSNTANKPMPLDDGSKQAQQSNVGRRSDMTAD